MSQSREVLERNPDTVPTREGVGPGNGFVLLQLLVVTQL